MDSVIVNICLQDEEVTVLRFAGVRVVTTDGFEARSVLIASRDMLECAMDALTHHDMRMASALLDAGYGKAKMGTKQLPAHKCLMATLSLHEQPGGFAAPEEYLEAIVSAFEALDNTRAHYPTKRLGVYSLTTVKAMEFLKYFLRSLGLHDQVSCIQEHINNVTKTETDDVIHGVYWPRIKTGIDWCKGDSKSQGKALIFAKQEPQGLTPMVIRVEKSVCVKSFFATGKTLDGVYCGAIQRNCSDTVIPLVITGDRSIEEIVAELRLDDRYVLAHAIKTAAEERAEQFYNPNDQWTWRLKFLEEAHLRDWRNSQK